MSEVAQAAIENRRGLLLVLGDVKGERGMSKKVRHRRMHRESLTCNFALTLHSGF
jgi:hypothetical protein